MYYIIEMRPHVSSEIPRFFYITIASEEERKVEIVCGDVVVFNTDGSIHHVYVCPDWCSMYINIGKEVN
jgi:hypothetical protein